MPEQVFVDASAWLAVADKGEARHSDAVTAYSNLLNNQAILVTTSLVVAETYILLRRRLGHRAAITFLKSVNDSPKIEIGYANANLETEAKRILHQYHDQDFSFADAVSFALMQERGITQAFAFDKHFAIAGFTLVPTL
jgi:predicted nucleic acid-binding protein